jgi:L-ascorbate metabolism protein UlaG (beta-lactamase superfamily)
MAQFDDRATRPSRGPGDMFKWKVLRKSDPRSATYAELDKIRPGTRDGGAAALASGDPCAVWIGHATWALRLGGRLLVIDPVWSSALSGVVKRLVPPGVAFGQLPAPDIVMVTHDHRDHLDLPSIAKLPETALYIAPLGNGPRLGKPNVVELDWWQTHELGDLKITLVPARHWSMRMPWNRNATLWGGYVIESPEGVAYHSGDTAAGDHFADIGAKFSIDWAMLPIGAYSPRWFMSSQHVNPDEAADGFAAVGATNFLAMHWGTFKLTDEPTGEPRQRILEVWRERGWDPSRLWLMDVGEARPLTGSP